MGEGGTSQNYSPQKTTHERVADWASFRQVFSLSQPVVIIVHTQPSKQTKKKKLEPSKFRPWLRPRKTFPIVGRKKKRKMIKVPRRSTRAVELVFLPSRKGILGTKTSSTTTTTTTKSESAGEKRFLKNAFMAVSAANKRGEISKEPSEILGIPYATWLPPAARENCSTIEPISGRCVFVHAFFNIITL